MSDDVVAFSGFVPEAGGIERSKCKGFKPLQNEANNAFGGGDDAPQNRKGRWAMCPNAFLKGS